LAISRKRKEQLVAQYAELLDQSKAVFLVDYSGVSVAQMEDLRGEVREANGNFQVTKNTLLRLAFKERGRPIPEEMLEGQTAAGFALEELPAMAKALVNFADEIETFRLKGGMMNGEYLSTEEIESLAKLPSLDELRAQLIGLIGAPARNVASTVASGVRQLVNVVDAYSAQENGAEEAA
jgi:large subunit ribosomal protein L10